MIATLAQAPEDLLRADEDLDVALSRVVKAGGSGALPVVDDKGALLGALSASEIMVELEYEATEDASMYSGNGAVETYFGARVRDLVRSRAAWLLALLVLQSASSVVLTRFSALLEKHLALAVFLTVAATHGVLRVEGPRATELWRGGCSERRSTQAHVNCSNPTIRCSSVLSGGSFRPEYKHLM